MLLEVEGNLSLQTEVSGSSFCKEVGNGGVRVSVNIEAINIRIE